MWIPYGIFLDADDRSLYGINIRLSDGIILKCDDGSLGDMNMNKS